MKKFGIEKKLVEILFQKEIRERKGYLTTKYVDITKIGNPFKHRSSKVFLLLYLYFDPCSVSRIF